MFFATGQSTAFFRSHAAPPVSIWLGG